MRWFWLFVFVWFLCSLFVKMSSASDDPEEIIFGGMFIFGFLIAIYMLIYATICYW